MVAMLPRCFSAFPRLLLIPEIAQALVFPGGLRAFGVAGQAEILASWPLMQKLARAR